MQVIFKIFFLILLTPLMVFANTPKVDHLNSTPKAIIFDMDGVLRNGNNALPGANAIIQTMQERNILGMILTNECRFSGRQIRADLDAMGINYPKEWEIYTAADSMRDFINEKILPTTNSDYHFFVIGEFGLRKAISEIENERIFIHDSFPEHIAKSEDELFVVFGTVENIRILDLEQANIWIKKGAKVLSTCPDAADPSSKGEKLLGMPGHLIHMLQKNAPCKAYSVGKPNPFIIKKAVALLNKKIPNIKPKEILFIGDSLDTDITSAFQAEMNSALVLTGNTNLEVARSQVIKPNIIVDSLNDLSDIIRQA